MKKIVFTRRGNLKKEYYRRLSIARRFGVSITRVCRVKPSGNYHPFRAVASGDADYVVLYSQ